MAPLRNSVLSDLAIRVRDDAKARELARALKRRAPDLQCSVCGHRDFGMLEEPSSGQRTHLERGHIDLGLLAGMKLTQPLVTLVCTNCGHLVQFAEAPLLGAQPDQYGQASDD
jgi:transcription elongation factor Elf1